ncbi:MAG: Trk system potassium transporter TrkA [Lachnospiraceae bacterium]|nr:Trk system potassium transporter TrkA [Lachnospiraceae bacterium]
MNIIIIGCGKVGSTLAEQLYAEDHDIVVIDNRESALNRVTDSCDLMGIEGDGASSAVLREAGADKADLVIAVTDADELNLYMCLLAKKCGAANTIARIRKPVYHEDIHNLKGELGLSLMINPEKIAALEMSRLIRFPSAIEVDSFARGNVEIYTFKVTRESPLCGSKIAELSGLLKGNVRICTIERDEGVFIPTGDFVIRPGDKLSIICAPSNATRLFKKLNANSIKAKNAMIIGGSRTAYYLADILLKSGIDVKIIERDNKRCHELSQILDEAVIINGDGMNQDLLMSEGINKADAVVTLTNFDEENIMLSLYARQVSRAKCITKVDRIVFDNIVDTLPLDSVIRPRELTAEAIVRYVRAVQNSFGSNVETLYKLNDGKAEALEFKVGSESDLVSKPLSELKFKDYVHVGSINRNGKIIIPKGSDTIEVGDTVIIVTTHKGLKDLSDVMA